jgi:hypothetical protein
MSQSKGIIKERQRILRMQERQRIARLLQEFRPYKWKPIKRIIK